MGAAAKRLRERAPMNGASWLQRIAKKCHVLNSLDSLIKETFYNFTRIYLEYIDRKKIREIGIITKSSSRGLYYLPK
jgi:hypothetical protein